MKRKSKPAVKRASLDVKKLQMLTNTTLKKVAGGGYRGMNAYWN